MNVSTNFFLNVALHTAVLSIFASLLLSTLRHARHRSLAAVAGLLAVGFLPWVTAVRPTVISINSDPEIPNPAFLLPTWTLAAVPISKENPPSTTLDTAPEKFIFPDPPTLFTALWITGTGISLLLLAHAIFKAHVWRKSLLLLDDTAWQTLQDIIPEIPARHHFRLSETSASPCVSGFLHPVIVLPRFLFTPDQKPDSVGSCAMNLPIGKPETRAG